MSEKKILGTIVHKTRPHRILGVNELHAGFYTIQIVGGDRDDGSSLSSGEQARADSLDAESGAAQGKLSPQMQQYFIDILLRIINKLFIFLIIIILIYFFLIYFCH